MIDKNKITKAIQDAKELKVLFDQIKNDTEDFLSRAKILSETSTQEAKDMIDLLKNNWQKVVSSFSNGSGLAGLFVTTGKKANVPAGKARLKKQAKKSQAEGSAQKAPAKKVVKKSKK